MGQKSSKDPSLGDVYSEKARDEHEHGRGANLAPVRADEGRLLYCAALNVTAVAFPTPGHNEDGTLDKDTLRERAAAFTGQTKRNLFESTGAAYQQVNVDMQNFFTIMNDTMREEREGKKIQTIHKSASPEDENGNNIVCVRFSMKESDYNAFLNKFPHGQFLLLAETSEAQREDKIQRCLDATYGNDPLPQIRFDA